MVLEVLVKRHGVRDHTTLSYPIKGMSLSTIRWMKLICRPGYDVAWFTSPTRSLGDAQVTAEYIAYNIKRLADMSATKKVFIIGHSQGNINIQWALAFWPSMRRYVTGFSSLAGDFHGEPSCLASGGDADHQELPRDHYCVPLRTSFKVDVSPVFSSRASDQNTSRPKILLVDLP